MSPTLLEARVGLPAPITMPLPAALDIGVDASGKLLGVARPPGWATSTRSLLGRWRARLCDCESKECLNAFVLGGGDARRRGRRE